MKILALTLFLLANFLYAKSDIEDKIKQNEAILKKSEKSELQTSIKIKLLAKQIEQESQELEQLEKEISELNKIIDNQKDELSDSKKELNNLQKNADELLKEKKENEQKIVETLIQNFSSTLGVELANKESMQEIIDNQIYEILLRESKDDIIRLNSNYLEVSQNKKENERKIEKIKDYIKKSEEEKAKLNKLLKNQEDKISSFESKHKAYQGELKNLLQKQNSLSDLLSNLNILKKVEDNKKAEEERKRKERLQALLEEKKRKKELEKRKEQEKKSVKKSEEIKVVENKSVKNIQDDFVEDIDLDVRILGSSTKGIKISKYRGEKTIAPLKDYTIEKKFGTYYDPVYKIKLFNESLILKTKEPQAKVLNVLNGKVVYAKEDSGMLDNVVIIQHSKGIHTIYSHLDQISPTLKVGKWIKKGYTVGRVNDTLSFQVTKDKYHIDPEEIFK